MSLTITIPTRLTTLDSARCDYFAAHNPLNIKAERKDFAVTTTQDDGSGNTRINITGSLPTLTVGGTVYCAAGSTTAGLYGEYVILSNVTGYVIIDTPFTGALSGGYINLTTDRPNYFISTRLQATYPNFPLPGGALPYIYRQDRPDTSGVATIDIQQNVSTKFTPLNEFTFDVTDKIDTNNCIQYSVEFLECWDGSAESYSSPSYVNAVNAAMQVQNTGGSCMVNYITSGVNDALKWLSDNRTVRYWEGLPFDAQLLFYSEDLATFLTANPGLQISRRELLNGGGQLSLTNLSIGGSIINNTYERIMLAGSYGASVEKIDLQVGYLNGPTFNPLTESLRVRIHREIPCNPVYLTWQNKAGGWSYYCFSCVQQLGRKVKDEGEFSKSFDNLADQYATSTLLGKSSEPFMTVGGSGFDFDDIQLMISLTESLNVSMLMNTPTWVADGPKWRTVKVEPGDFNDFKTKRTLHNFELKLRLPKTNIQRN